MRQYESDPKRKNIYGEEVEILSREEGCLIYRLSDGTGDIVMTSYMVFPGIELIYNDVHMKACSINRAPIGNILEINHCREEHIEYEFRDEFCYLFPGALAIARGRRAQELFSAQPLSRNQHYDRYRAVAAVLFLLSGRRQHRSPALVEKFCGGNKCFISCSKPYVEPIFSELYSVSDSIRKGLFQDEDSGTASVHERHGDSA
mgnify:CR=1 FL=1